MRPQWWFRKLQWRLLGPDHRVKLQCDILVDRARVILSGKDMNKTKFITLYVDINSFYDAYRYLHWQGEIRSRTTWMKGLPVLLRWEPSL